MPTTLPASGVERLHYLKMREKRPTQSSHFARSHSLPRGDLSSLEFLSGSAAVLSVNTSCGYAGVSSRRESFVSL
jgi:hypothetical protein